MRRSRADVAAVLCLVLWTSLALCYSHGRWTVEAWRSPVRMTGDAPMTMALFKAISEGAVLPFLSKTVPRLNAPHAANWNDSPVLVEGLIALWVPLTRVVGLFEAMNVALWIAHLAAALAFYGAARLLDAAPLPSLLAAGAFALSKYMWVHGFEHIELIHCWHLPLCVAAVLGLLRSRIVGKRPVAAVGLLCIATGWQNQYYAWMCVQLFALTAIALALHHRRTDALKASGFALLTLVAFSLTNLDTLFYWWGEGRNTLAVVRPLKDLLLLGLRLPDLLLPASHRWTWLQDWAQLNYFEPIKPVSGGYFASYLGIVGVLAIGALVYGGAVAVLTGRASRADPLFWLAAWVYFYAVAGGANLLTGALGLVFIRATNRYSILLLAIALLYGAMWLTRRGLTKRAHAAVAVVVVATICWDQLPEPPSAVDAASARSYFDAQRDFGRALEAGLPRAAMVFQLPVMGYPEPASISGMENYEEFFPYLFTTDLRFSYGTHKGRPREAWQRPLALGPATALVKSLQSFGFSALLVHRAAVTSEQVEGIESLLGPPFAVSALANAAAYRLHPAGGQ